ncbi:MAG TPA: 3-hydroxyacyl-ACP dehydratase FabZ family protein [Phycisphaerae bacterium]|nr:3-hydroxyacyl-ACP dehydratase FabZ family protein [Phycisphaerae bacterium]
MAAPPLFDFNSLDLSRIVISREQVYEILPHRYEFMQVDGFVYLDKEQRIGVGLREVREDEFWVKGHIPGRPLLPGVLMLETAAQMASFLSHQVRPDERFMAFGGLDNVKFRGTVVPGSRMYVLLKGIEIRPRRTVCDAQGFVDNKMVFEARITGLPVS